MAFSSTSLFDMSKFLHLSFLAKKLKIFGEKLFFEPNLTERGLMRLS